MRSAALLLVALVLSIVVLSACGAKLEGTTWRGPYADGDHLTVKFSSDKTFDLLVGSGGEHGHLSGSWKMSGDGVDLQPPGQSPVHFLIIGDRMTANLNGNNVTLHRQ